MSLEHFNAEVAASFPSKYQKTLFIPIHLPTLYQSRLGSAAAISSGPGSAWAERSGIEFQFRAVGGRRYGDDDDEDPEKAKKKDYADGDDMEEEEAQREETTEGMPVEAMSSKQLKGLFGRARLNMMGAMLQHTSQVGTHAGF